MKPRFRLDHGRMIPIVECQPGNAMGCTEFSNRGLPDMYHEVTYWPKTQKYRLTTGAEFRHVMGKPEPMRLSNQEKWICSVLGLDEFSLGIFLRSWEPGKGEHVRVKGKRPETLEELRFELWRTGPTRRVMQMRKRAKV